MNDLDYWRKKNNLPPNAKIFIVVGGYPALRRGLLKRGKQLFIIFDLINLIFFFQIK